MRLIERLLVGFVLTMQFIESFLIGLIGRPLLKLIKWLRWPLLFYGFYFNAISTYDPQTKAVISEKITYIPFLVGLILFSIGLTVKRYDKWVKDHQHLMMKVASPF